MKIPPTFLRLEVKHQHGCHTGRRGMSFRYAFTESESAFWLRRRFLLEYVLSVLKTLSSPSPKPPANPPRFPQPLSKPKMSITLSCMYEKPLYFYFSNGTNNFFSYSGLLKLLGSYSITLTNLVIIWTLRTNQLVYWIMTPKKHTGLSLNQYSVQELVEFFLTAADLISYCALKGSPQSVFIELYCFFVLDKI